VSSLEQARYNLERMNEQRSKFVERMYVLRLYPNTQWRQGANVKDWECSFDEGGQASGRTRTSSYNTLSRYLELSAIAFTSENPSRGRSVREKQVAPQSCVPCGVRAQAELMVGRNTNNKQTNKQPQAIGTTFRTFTPACWFWVRRVSVSSAESSCAIEREWLPRRVPFRWNLRLPKPPRTCQPGGGENPEFLVSAKPYC
jgi:hypothetical protein